MLPVIKQMQPVIKQMQTSTTTAVFSHSCVNVLWLCQEETVTKRKQLYLQIQFLISLLRLAKNDCSDNSDAKHNKNNIGKKGYQLPSFRYLVYLKNFLVSTCNQCDLKSPLLLQHEILPMSDDQSVQWDVPEISSKWKGILSTCRRAVISWNRASADSIIETFKWPV